jgi:hypothetical protein
MVINLMTSFGLFMSCALEQHQRRMFLRILLQCIQIKVTPLWPHAKNILEIWILFLKLILFDIFGDDSAKSSKI